MGDEVLTKDSLNHPQVGDIWKIGDHYHYLVLEERLDYWDEKQYYMYILERDMYDCLSLDLIECWNGVKVA